VSTENSFKYDVFISYRQLEPDLTWVRKRLVSGLTARGVRPFIDYRNFRLGAPLIQEMERGVVESHYTLAVLSPDYLASNFTEVENLMADHLGLEVKQRRLLALVLRPCDASLRMRFRLWLDATDDANFEPNLDRLAAEIRGGAEE
jgi:hypothetical protein